MKTKTEREEKRGMINRLNGFLYLLIFMAVSVCILLPAKPARAASYQYLNAYEEDAAAGGTRFYMDGKVLKAVRGGKTITVLSSSNGWVSSAIVTDGKSVFAVSCKSAGTGFNSYTQNTVYKIQVSSQKKTKLFSVKSTDAFSLCGYYKGKLFYVKGADPGALWSYQLSSGTKKKIAGNVTTAEQNGKYFYLTPYRGSWCPCSFKVYNASTGKTTQISSKMLNYYVGKTKVYYVESKTASYSSSGYTVSIKSCSLNGTGKKTLKKQLKAGSGGKLTEHSWQYCLPGKSTYKTIKF